MLRVVKSKFDWPLIANQRDPPSTSRQPRSEHYGFYKNNPTVFSWADGPSTARTGTQDAQGADLTAKALPVGKMEHLVAIPASDSDVVVKLFTGTCSSTASMTVALLDGAGKPLANKVRPRPLAAGAIPTVLVRWRPGHPRGHRQRRTFYSNSRLSPYTLEARSETPWHCKQKSRAQSGWIERDSFTFNYS